MGNSIYVMWHNSLSDVQLRGEMADPNRYKDLRVYLDTEIHLRLKLLCVKINRSMSSVAAELIEDWLETAEKAQEKREKENPCTRQAERHLGQGRTNKHFERD